MKKQKKNRGRSSIKAHWYVEVDSYTNTPVAEYLAGVGKGPENCYIAMPDEDGIVHQVWEVPQRFIHVLENARLNDPNISFTVFSRPDTAQTIRIWPFTRISRDNENGPKPRKNPAVVDAEAQLKRLLQKKYRKKKPASK